MPRIKIITAILIFLSVLPLCFAEPELPLNHGPISATATPTKSTAEFYPPESLNLPVPFFSQAPLGNWNLPWREACEEASSLLAANFYYLKNWNASQFNDQILKLVEWEKTTFGNYIDTSVDQTAYMLKTALGLNSIIHENPQYYQVKTILAQGHVIIFPVDGRELSNPNYINGGPRYHMILLKGYTADGKIITNDVGTSQGADYLYHWSTLWNANHDLATPIDDGAKKIIEVLPPQAPAF